MEWFPLSRFKIFKLEDYSDSGGLIINKILEVLSTTENYKTIQNRLRWSINLKRKKSSHANLLDLNRGSLKIFFSKIFKKKVSLSDETSFLRRVVTSYFSVKVKNSKLKIESFNFEQFPRNIKKKQIAK